jgi:subtilisin family serine protease
VLERRMLSGHRRLPPHSAPAVQRRLPSAATTHDLTDFVSLGPLMRRSTGRADVVVALVDGPVEVGVAELQASSIRSITGGPASECAVASSAACEHGTFVASILVGRRGSVAPAICPDCPLLVRPIFVEASPRRGVSATAEDLTEAIAECVRAGARVINVSASLTPSTVRAQRNLAAALDTAARRGALVVAASGNEGVIGSTALTNHPWVVPVVAFGRDRRPLPDANLGRGIGRRGVGAPGQSVTALGPDGRPRIYSGSSAAAPFVTGALALCMALLEGIDGPTLRRRIGKPLAARQTIVPPVFDAWNTYTRLAEADPVL